MSQDSKNRYTNLISEFAIVKIEKIHVKMKIDKPNITLYHIPNCRCRGRRKLRIKENGRDAWL